MREIVFRGIDSSSKCFVKGFYFGDHPFDNISYIGYTRDTAYEVNSSTVGQFTGFKDNKGNEIFEGDILSDWNEVDGKQVQSKLQVYWCEKTGAWKLDNTYDQNKSSGDLLCDELENFAYEITGNIYDEPKE